MNKVMIQYFEWYLPDDASLWRKVINNAKKIADSGFDLVWLPPAYKGQGGKSDVGYGVYDLYDLGEFDQKGTITTKYGSKDEYLKAIAALHDAGITVLADMVFNHRMGADRTETVSVITNKADDRNQDLAKMDIDAWTYFDFKGRGGKYSNFIYDKSCFSGVDYDNRRQKTAIYRLAEDWDQNVDKENGNYDYLMGADLNFSNPSVVEELYRYGRWYLDMTKVDGFRLDALKHITSDFFKDWLDAMCDHAKRQLFTVGEYWSNDLNTLLDYLKRIDDRFALFDVPLHYKFYKACNDNSNYNMADLHTTLSALKPDNAVTFVENHDTQKGQALQTVVTDWFKPLAYAYILLRDEGLPCVFYGDYYGIAKYQTTSFRKPIDLMIKIRKNEMNGRRNDYFDHFDVASWTFEGQSEHDGMAVLINDGPMNNKRMFVGKNKAGKEFINLVNEKDSVIIDEDGYGIFNVGGGSYSIYINKDNEFKYQP